MSRTSALGTAAALLLPPPSAFCGLGRGSWAAWYSGGTAGPQPPGDMGTGTEDTLPAQPLSSAATVAAEQPGHNYYLHQSQLCIHPRSPCRPGGGCSLPCRGLQQMPPVQRWPGDSPAPGATPGTEASQADGDTSPLLWGRGSVWSPPSSGYDKIAQIAALEHPPLCNQDSFLHVPPLNAPHPPREGSQRTPLSCSGGKDGMAACRRRGALHGDVQGARPPPCGSVRRNECSRAQRLTALTAAPGPVSPRGWLGHGVRLDMGGDIGTSWPQGQLPAACSGCHQCAAPTAPTLSHPRGHGRPQHHTCLQRGGGTRSDCSRQQSELRGPPMRWAPGIKPLMSCRLEGQQRVINQGLWLMSLVLTLPSHPRALAPYIPCARSLSLCCPPLSTCACVPGFAIKKATFCSAGIKPVDSIQAEPALNGPSAPSTHLLPDRAAASSRCPREDLPHPCPVLREDCPRQQHHLSGRRPQMRPLGLMLLSLLPATRGSSTRRGWQCPACSHCWRSTPRARISAHREGFAA